jgi:ubiquinone/menaquinone biosynthesis C-methylase UbiE
MGMITRLKARAAKAGVINMTAIVGSATQPNVPPESFDVIYLCTVLGEIPKREALKPGGQLSITEIFPDPHFQSRYTVWRLVEAAGFRLKEWHGRWYFFTVNFVKE